MKKKLSLLAMASIGATVVAAAPQAHAEIPNNSIIIGDQAFSIQYLFQPGAKEEINNAITSFMSTNPNGKIFFQLDGMNTQFTDIFSGEPASEQELNSLPEITFKDENGNLRKFAAGNGEEIDSETPLEVEKIY